MEITDKIRAEFRKAKNALEKAENICIISHRNPDGDAIGANLALRLALKSFGKNVVSACTDSLPNNSLWLEEADKFTKNFNYEDFDTIITVDCGAKSLLGFDKTKPELFSEEKTFINFDHHISNELFGTINVVDTEACSASIIVYNFLEFCDWKITMNMATCLLHGIYFDTGGMMHSNTTSSVLKTASKLMLKGAELRKVSKELFHTTPVNKLRLMGRILERAHKNEDDVVISAVSQEDYAACETEAGDTGGTIDFLNAVPNAKYCILLSEDPKKGIVKGSLRTQREDVNLSEIASQWGGGGHPKASGFGLKGALQPVVNWKITPKEEGEANGKELKF